MASVSRERAEIFRVGTYRISRFPGLSVIDYAAGACSRTSSTYAREILHATEMARPTINYGRTWYSIHGPARGDPVRIRKPLHAIAIDPDRINRVQPREKEREREKVGGKEGGRKSERAGPRTVAFIHVTIGAFTYVHVRKGNPVTPRCITPPARAYEE